MGQGNIRLLKTLPGPQNDASILAEFCSRGEGYVTALDSKHLAALRFAVPSEADVELLEFGRMVAAYARLAGTDPRSMASNSHTIAAIGKVCEGLNADSPFYGSRQYVGLHKRIAETVKELGDWGLDPSVLALLVAECSQDLQPKLKSLADVWARTESLLGEFNCELSYRHIASSIAASPDRDVSFPRCLIFLDGQLAPKHVEWMKWAASVGGQLTVVVESSPSTDALFPIADKVEKHLGLTGILVGESKPFVTSLFAGTISPPGLQADQFRAADPLAEVEWTLRRILERVEGNEFHRLGVFARNLEDYGPLIESAAARLGVPIRIARKESLASNGYIRTLVAVLEALESGDVRRLQVFARSSFFLFPNSLRKPFAEAMSTAFREGDQAWAKFEKWASELQEIVPWLAALLAWRRDSAAKPTNLASWRERLRELGNTFPAISIGDFRERDFRAKNSFERTLGSRATFLDQGELDLGQALVEVKAAAEESDYTLPSKPVGVQVSDAPNGFASVDHLFVLGMLEGVFPKRRSESPILTDADRQEIYERRAMLFPMQTSFDGARRERDSFVALCSVPEKAITFSYPETTDDRDNIRAFYLEEVKRALGGDIEDCIYPRSQLTPAQSDCRSENDRKLRLALDGLHVPALILPNIETKTRETLAARVPEALKPRELRTALECPFRHFAQEALRLYPDRDRRRWYQLRQLPQNARLTIQPDADSAKQALRSLLAAELEDMRPHVTESEFELMRQGGERLIQDWVKREFRARQIWPKDEGSQRPMVTFGAETLRGELPRVGKVAGAVAGTARMGPYKVVQMVGSNTPVQDKTSLLGLKDRDALYYGVHLMAGFEKGSAMALEVESMSGGRKMMLLPRLDEPPIIGDIEAGLEVSDLSGKGEAQVTTEVFFERVKDLIGQASKAIREVDIRATPGDHCSFCDHGELCRQSAEFGESDSPFEGEDG
ncbi:MAG: PD-(D/E)XK nuclease family protein [Chlorobia bacterium]|nr:PD-(D/E)XK nuclease family protein [Fimbriimonadaceae bacterium]